VSYRALFNQQLFSFLRLPWLFCYGLPSLIGMSGRRERTYFLARKRLQVRTVLRKNSCGAWIGLISWRWLGYLYKHAKRSDQGINLQVAGVSFCVAMPATVWNT